MERISLKPGDVSLGQPLPWPVYDHRDVMLLRQGKTVDDFDQLMGLMERGAWHPPLEETAVSGSSRRKRPRIRVEPFARLGMLMSRIRRMHQRVFEQKEEGIRELYGIRDQLMELVHLDADAMIAAVHLWRQFPYSTRHAAFAAILTTLLARTMELKTAKSVVGAALVQNVGFYEEHDRMASSVGVLGEAERLKLQAHPEASVKYLTGVGVEDEVLIEAVRNHHERIDGEGYPRGLSGYEVARESQLLAITDQYIAMTSPRLYRDALNPLSALTQLFFVGGRAVDREVSDRLIRVLSVAPPGASVALDDGVTALVVRRGNISGKPLVAAADSVDDRGRARRENFLRILDCQDAGRRVVGPAQTFAVQAEDLEYLWLENPSAQNRVNP